MRLAHNGQVLARMLCTAHCLSYHNRAWAAIANPKLEGMVYVHWFIPAMPAWLLCAGGSRQQGPHPFGLIAAAHLSTILRVLPHVPAYYMQTHNYYR
jgi:hypothetical protein